LHKKDKYNNKARPSFAVIFIKIIPKIFIGFRRFSIPLLPIVIPVAICRFLIPFYEGCVSIL